MFCLIGAEFRQFLNHRIHVVVTGKRVNQGAGFDLEIAADYIFQGDSRVTTWLKKASEKLNVSLNIKIEKRVNLKHLKIE